MATPADWLQSHACRPAASPQVSGVEAVRRQLLALLDDCDGMDCERLRWRLHTAECAQDLWLLRAAVGDAVASQHCLAQAHARIAGLAPAFRRVLPVRQA